MLTLWAWLKTPRGEELACRVGETLLPVLRRIRRSR